MDHGERQGARLSILTFTSPVAVCLVYASKCYVILANVVRVCRISGVDG